MVARRHLLSLLTLAALLVGPFAIAPGAADAQASTITYEVDRLSDDAPPASGTYCTAAPNDCSLRQAITLARRSADDAANKVISFRLGLSGQIVIANDAAGPLPPLTNRIAIQGSIVGGAPAIEVVGGNGSRSVGFQIAGNNNTIGGLAIYGFNDAVTAPGNGTAISISGDANRVIGNVIGLRANGAAPASADRNVRGVQINPGADNNLIGFDDTLGGVANTISGNSGVGVELRDASSNVIAGNYIGVSFSGPIATLSGNGSYGIQITSNTGFAQRNRIGGTGGFAANIIGGNNLAGVRISGSETLSTTIQGNFIGIYANNIDVGNLGHGVLIENGARATSLAGGSSTPLLISGNNLSGVFIRNGAQATEISGRTLIGINFTEDGPLTNGQDGVRVSSGSPGTRILGSGVRIGGNTGAGVRVEGFGSDGARVDGAYIGVVPSPATPNTTVAVANAGGVLVADGAADATITGSTISGNSLFGIRLSETDAVTVTANFVGLNLARSGVTRNLGPGIDVYSSTNTLIGGALAAAGNYVAGNGGPGVLVRGSGAFSTTVDANTIGLLRNPSTTRYTNAGANGAEGILIQDGPRQTVIGGAVGNVIGGAAADAAGPVGLRVLSTPPEAADAEPITVTLTTISRNTIGAIPNANLAPVRRALGAGISVEGAGVSGVQIFSNTVGLNAGDGVRVTAAQTVTIGVENTISGNGGRGVFVNGGATDVRVISNTIRSNVGAAVRLEDPATRRVSIRSNRMAANGAAVQLVGATRYGGSGPDAVAGPNHDIDPPFNIRVNQGGLIVGQVYTSTLLAEDALSPVSACVSCTIQVFRPDPALAAPDGQGWDLLPLEGGEVIVPAADGTFTARLVGPLPNQLLFAATDGYGNTSEFATFTASAGLRIVPVDPPSASQSAAPGQTITYTLRLENTGSVDLTNVELTAGGSKPGWTVNRLPQGTVSVPGLGSLLVTYTLTLPTGSAPGVRVPITDTTTITATAFVPTSVRPGGVVTATQRLTTTVLALPLLRVAPVRDSGTARPGQLVTYSHRLFNDGNITVTVNLETSTLDPADSQQIWNDRAQLSITQVTLGPGESRDVALNVRVPDTAQVGVVATHLITATAVGYPDQTRFFSDTTRVVLERRAELFSDDEQDGRPGGTVNFFHTVRNLSNGPATFQLAYQSNLGSTVRFISETPGVTIGPNNTFTLSNVDDPPGSTNRLSLRAEVTLDRRLFPGDQEVINIFLRDPATGESIGGAAVVDRVIIRGDAGLVEPRLWLPMLFNGAAPQQ